MPRSGSIGRRLPHGRAAVLPRVVVRGPGVVADFAGTRNRVEGPDELAGLRVERLHAAASAAVAAREARDHEAVVVERGGRDAEAVRVRFRLHGPDHGAAAWVEREQLAVELARVDLAVADRDAAAHPAAADHRDVRVEVSLVRPQDLAAVGVESEHVVRAGRYVDHAVVDDRLRLARVLAVDARTVQVRAPLRL